MLTTAETQLKSWSPPQNVYNLIQGQYIGGKCGGGEGGKIIVVISSSDKEDQKCG